MQEMACLWAFNTPATRLQGDSDHSLTGGSPVGTVSPICVLLICSLVPYKAPGAVWGEEQGLLAADQSPGILPLLLLISAQGLAQTLPL